MSDGVDDAGGTGATEEGLAPEPAGLTDILQALEQAVVQARAMPMSSSVLVNRAEVLDLLDQAYAVLPAQLSQADEVLAGADQVRADADGALAAAQEQAEQVIAAARVRAEELVSSDQVVVAARLRAERIVADGERTADTLRREAEESAEAVRQEARRTAESLRHDADQYCDRRLAQLETDLDTVLVQVRAGRAKLAERLDPPG